ncbi:MAG: hypothetical protein WCZ66_05870 [Sphingomonadaceae bacterium]
MTTIAGIVSFSFDFDEPGGRDHLLPGRPLVQTQTLDRPRGSGFVVGLSGFNAAFVTGGNFLTQRPLGQFRVNVGIRNFNELVCSVRLTDENMDDAIRVIVRGTVMFFTNP